MEQTFGQMPATTGYAQNIQQSVTVGEREPNLKERVMTQHQQIDLLLHRIDELDKKMSILAAALVHQFGLEIPANA